MMTKIKKILYDDSLWAPLIAVAWNILLLFAVAFIARLEFYLKNEEFFTSITGVREFLRVSVAGVRFDAPGIFYVNIPYILMMLLPLHFKERRVYYLVCKWVYIILNSVALIVNFADSVYYPFTLRRTAFDILTEFSHESNAGSVVGVELLHNWWLVLLAGIIIWGLWKIYLNPRAIYPCGNGGRNRLPGQRMHLKYYGVMTASLVIAAVICISGIRGGWLNHWQNYLIALPLIYMAWRMRKIYRYAAYFSGILAAVLLLAAPVGGWRHRDIRPIALSNANAYARHPSEVALILNTPFSLLRTLNSNPYPVTEYYKNPEEMAGEFSPVHYPKKCSPVDSISGSQPAGMTKKNVVVIILESFGEEYVDALNDHVLGKKSPGFAPFMDSLARRSLRFTHTYDNGSKSIDAMPSILASIPRFARPFILTSSAVEPIDGIPALLGREGYSTAFFHGARTGSMGFDGFARLVGFDNYFGREDFEADRRFGGEAEFDGYWAIWDEPFFQYYALKMSDMPRPFMTSIFSATSHHPFHVPAKYEGKFPKGTLPIHQCIGYTDMALRKFFETAEKTDWYRNTIFVITNDHTNQRAHDEYRSDIGVYYGPLLIFDPSEEIVKPGLRDGIISQIDIMPTLLGMLNYDKEYSAYGVDMSAPGSRGHAVSYINDFYQYVEGDYIIQFDGKKTVGIYNINDHLLRRNLLRSGSVPKEVVDGMERRLKALIQTYMTRRGR